MHFWCPSIVFSKNVQVFRNLCESRPQIDLFCTLDEPRHHGMVSADTETRRSSSWYVITWWLINGDVNLMHATYDIKVMTRFSGTVLCLKLLDTGVSAPRAGFVPRPAHVGLVEGEVPLGQTFLSVFRPSAVSTPLQMLHAHSFFLPSTCTSPTPYSLGD
jgi:hypothetical protein